MWLREAETEEGVWCLREPRGRVYLGFGCVADSGIYVGRMSTRRESDGEGLLDLPGGWPPCCTTSVQSVQVQTGWPVSSQGQGLYSLCLAHTRSQ